MGLNVKFYINLSRHWVYLMFAVALGTRGFTFFQQPIFLFSVVFGLPQELLLRWSLHLSAFSALPCCQYTGVLWCEGEVWRKRPVLEETYSVMNKSPLLNWSVSLAYDPLKYFISAFQPQVGQETLGASVMGNSLPQGGGSSDKIF